MSVKPRILITGAAGHTGTPAVHDLLKKGFPVRALVRRRDGRSERLAQAGAEVVVGNLTDMGDLRRAMTDVQRAYHAPPFAPNLLHGSMLFALAAEEAGLETVALLSGWNPHPNHPSIITREHWMANNLYRWMPNVDVIHVNPGVFAFLYFLGLPAAAHFGMLMLPFGDGLNAPPSNEDIGAVAAGVLADPAPHIGKSYRPTGPQLISGHDAADIMGQVLGRSVRYRDVSVAMFLKAATALKLSSFEMAQIRHYADEMRYGTFAVGAPTDHVELVTGRAPDDFETIAQRFVANPELVRPGFAIGTKLQATLFTLRMLLARVPDLDRWEREQNNPQLNAPTLAHDSPEWRAAAEQQRLLLAS